MTDPIKPISKAAQITNPYGSDSLPTETSSSSSLEPLLPQWKIEAQSSYIQDQTSQRVAADTFVSGEEVLAASLALFELESKPRTENQISPAQKTLEMDRLDYLLGLSSSRVVGKKEGASTELQKYRDEFANLYAAYASEQARLEKIKKSKNIWKRISEFLKSIFLK